MKKSEQRALKDLSKRLINAQRPIRILDAIKWSDDTKQAFLNRNGQALPAIDHEYYQINNPLTYEPKDKINEFNQISRDAINQFGELSATTQLIDRRCKDYINAMNLLASRGTPDFAKYSIDLYGAPDDAFYAGGPRLSQFGQLLGDTVLQKVVEKSRSENDVAKYSPEQSMKILNKRLSTYFNNDDNVRVIISDNIVADAAAGADNIKLNANVNFSENDLRYLEVHEGWTHVGTTINGASQPLCDFLSKGPPGCSVTQEGLAVLTEIISMSSNPARLLKLINRIKSISMAHDGANFIEVFQFFKSQGYSDDDSYTNTHRIFRGSTADGGPFTKDLSYTKGFLQIYNYIQLAVKTGVLHHIELLFVGKIYIDEIHLLHRLHQDGTLISPRYIPPQFSDLAALSSWMVFSCFLNKFDLDVLEKQYRTLLFG